MGIVMKRPLLVTIIGIILMIAGVGQIAFGGLLLSQRNDAELLTEADITSSQALAIGLVTLVLGVLSIVFALGLFRGSRIARLFVGVLEIGQIIAATITIATLDSSRRASAIGSVVSALIVLYFLFGTDKAKRFFTKD